MQPHRHLRLVTPLTLLIALIGAIGHPGDVQAAETAGRLTLSVTLQRQASVRLGTDPAHTALTQQVDYAVTLVGDGVPIADNPLDPEDGARQLARARQRQQRVDGALAQAQARGPARGGLAPDLQALQAQAQQLQARCGTDRDCLVREAGRLSALQMAARSGSAGGDPAVAQRLQAYAAAARACEQQQAAGPARDACIDRARVGAGGAADGPGDDPSEAPYLLFRAAADCSPAGRVQIDERTTGSYADVQGRVAVTQTRHGDDRAAVAAQPCGTQAVVLDTRSGRLWVRNPLADLQPQGVTVRSESNRSPQRSEGPLALDWHEAAAWLQERLQRLDEAGSADTTLAAGSDGQTRVQLRWRWQRL